MQLQLRFFIAAATCLICNQIVITNGGDGADMYLGLLVFFLMASFIPTRK